MSSRRKLPIGIQTFRKIRLEPGGAAMAQLKERRSADQYRHPGQPIHLVAVEFSGDVRNLAAFEVERAA